MGVETLSIQVSPQAISAANEELHNHLTAWLGEHTAGFARKGVRFQMLDLTNSHAPFTNATLANKPPVTQLTVNLALGYDGRTEIAAAARAMARERCRLEACTTNLRRHLPTAPLPPVDLLIHAGGQTSLSGFLLWQSAYAELLFIETRWTSFDRAHLSAALDDYAQRKRTFGGLA